MSSNIDLHCHTSSKPFMSGIDKFKLNPFQFATFKLEHPIYKLLHKPLEKFSNIQLSTQSNFDFLFDGGVRVAFVSLTPMEKAFTVLNPDAKGFKSKLIKTFMGERSNYRDGFLSSAAINALTGYAIGDIDYIKNSAYNIYQDLFKKEIALMSTYKDKKSPNGKYTIRYPKNYAELSTFMEDPSNLNILLTVEGAHAFGSARTLQEIQNGRHQTHQKDNHNVSLALPICNNIRDTRLNSDLPIFSVGLCHHFWNGLAGHARSLSTLMESVVNQEEGLNGPLLDTGRMVIDALTQTDYDGKTITPVIVDIKHMSPQCRKDYYAYLKSKNSLKKHPVFCSHTGISISFETLSEWITYVKKNPMEKTGKQYEDGAYYLHEQSINLCREDLEEVFHSKGLIGIQLDEKRIMGPLALQELKKRSASNKSSEQKFIYAKAVWANMFAAVDELKQVGVTNLAEAWNMFAIGSDFDGLINHLDSFESAAKIPDLRTAMGYFLLEPEAITLFQSGEISYTLSIQDLEILKGGLSNQELIEKIFFKNAMEFLKRNY